MACSDLRFDGSDLAPATGATPAPPAYFASRAATVASGVNPPEQRPSVSVALRTGAAHQPSGTAMMARTRSRSKAAFSAQRSAFRLFSPERDAVRRAVPPATLRHAENPQGARRSAVGNRRHHTDKSGAFASGVNPPEERPSVSAATSHRRIVWLRARPEIRATWCGAKLLGWNWDKVLGHK
jgi:hypothetical protein